MSTLQLHHAAIYISMACHVLWCMSRCRSGVQLPYHPLQLCHERKPRQDAHHSRRPNTGTNGTRSRHVTGHVVQGWVCFTGGIRKDVAPSVVRVDVVGIELWAG